MSAAKCGPYTLTFHANALHSTMVTMIKIAYIFKDKSTVNTASRLIVTSAVTQILWFLERGHVGARCLR